MKTFDDEVKITGAIVTKMDGDARGGAALSISEVRHKESLSRILHLLEWGKVWVTCFNVTAQGYPRVLR